MATISRYKTASGATLYRVRHRQPDKRGFATKRDAERFAANVEVAKMCGEYVAPSAARVTVGEVGAAWLERQHGRVRPSGYAVMETTWRLRVKPRWGDVALGDIRPTAIQQWISVLGRGTPATKPVGASVVNRTHYVLSKILDDAVRDNLRQESGGRHQAAPRDRERAVYLNHPQVAALAAATMNTTIWYCPWRIPDCAGTRSSACESAIWTCCVGEPPSRRTPSNRESRSTSARPSPQAAHRAAP